MPLTRKYKTKNGSIKHKTYTTVRGQRAESYRREQNRQYRTKIRQLQPPRQRVYLPSQADTLPLTTVHQIIDEYRLGVSLNKLSTKYGISRYILTKVIKKYDDAKNILTTLQESLEGHYDRPSCECATLINCQPDALK